jgi:PAS domain S-box-containing protein
MLEFEQADDALRETEHRYRLLFESIDQGFCVCELVLDENNAPVDYRFLEVNLAFERMTGLEDPVGKTIKELVPDIENSWHEAYAEVVRTGESVRFESESVVMGRWFDVNAFCLGDRQSNKFAVLFSNITERKRTERALQASEENSRRILESITDGFFSIDENWCFTSINPQAERILGRTPAELVGRNMWQMYPGLLGSEFEQVYRRAAEQQIASAVTAFYPDHDRWYEAHAYPSPQGIAVYFRDVTDAVRIENERQQAVNAVQESKARLDFLLEAAQFGDWDLNLKDHTAHRSLRHDQIFGYDTLLPEWTYEMFLDHVLPEDRQEVDRQYREAIDCNRPWDIECRICRADQQIVWIWVSGYIYHDAMGEPMRMVGLVVDITAKKQADVEREQLLAREQSAREQAEKANRLKDEFLAVLSHELRTPLNPILGWSKILLGKPPTAAVLQQGLQAIERNAQLQTQLIGDLLDVSRILQGKLVLKATPVNLESVIRAALETVELAADAKKIQIETDLDSQVGVVLGDAGRLQQVLWNLLSNAVKFTPEAGQVRVRLQQKDNNAEIQVIDTGKGISADFLPFIFERFSQADSTTTRMFGGLGLGLAIVKQLVDLHGGTIQVDSPGEGLGTQFTVRIPLSPVQQLAGQPSRSMEFSQDLSGVRALLVDDEADSRMIAAYVLELAGATVQTAATAAEALDALSQSQPDVLISDIGMPEMDGYDLIKKIRSLPVEQGGHVLAIALTAFAGEYNQQQILAAGFQEYLAKPLDPEVLVQTIAKLRIGAISVENGEANLT